MILILLIFFPLAGGFLAWFFGRRNADLARWSSLLALCIDAVLLLILALTGIGSGSPKGTWLAEFNAPWIPQLGIGFHLAMDGLSLILVALTVFLGIMSVITSWTEITEKTGFFHLNLMLILSGIMGVFLAMDLFLFYFFWELMLIPMYFLISIWGHENRRYAAMKFFIFTQASGLLMLLAILGLYFAHGHFSGNYTFDYLQLLGTTMSPATSSWIMFGFFIAFAVKLPAVPFHNWLPDAHTEAPTAGSVILAGLLLKTGAYGLLRFIIPLFHEASRTFAPLFMALGAAGIIYGAFLAFAQTDLKRLVAYTSVSHMGFILLGVFALNDLALQGVVLQMVCHGISTGALFMLVGSLQERIHTRDMGSMGGFWAVVPRMGAVFLFFSLASLGLPGLGNFIAEILVLIGAYKASILITAVAATGLIFATVYSLWIVQRVFHGEAREMRTLTDLSVREMAAMAVLMITLLWLGLYPQPVLNTAHPALDNIRGSAVQSQETGDVGKQKPASSDGEKSLSANPDQGGIQ